MFSSNVRAWRDAGAFFDFQGHQCFYRQAGQGPDLLLLHGFPTCSYDFAKIAPGLEADWRTLCVDFLGYGFSDKPRRHKYLVGEHADQIEMLLDKRGISKYHLLAHDYGDTVAQELLARELERGSTRIRSVILLNGGLFPEVHQPRMIQRLLLGPAGPLIARLLNARRFERSFSEIFGASTQPSRTDLEEHWSLIEYKGGPAIYHLLIRYLNERRRHRQRWVGALQEFKRPMRFINGGADPVSGAHMARRYGELIANPDIVLLPELGHYPQWEDAQAVLDAIHAFYRSQGD
ncbi:MAG: alpha/beta hydrolase [Leptospirales bacterium]|nr:alpha/beta hydrolase [Leptospirales bacterium]